MVAVYMKMPMKMVQVRSNDPLLVNPYNQIYMADQMEKKKFYAELEVCRLHAMSRKLGITGDKLKKLQLQF